MGNMALWLTLPARLAVYAAVEGLALHGIVIAIVNGNTDLFAENAFIEWIQFSLILAAGCFFYLEWRSRRTESCALLLCSLLSFVAALRELDRFSEILLFEDAYKYPVALITFAALYVLWSHRRTLGSEIDEYAAEPAFYLLAFGSFLTAIVAQVLGQAELWHAIVEGSGGRVVKRVIEESLETLGYLLIAIGAGEARLYGLRQRSESSFP